MLAESEFTGMQVGLAWVCHCMKVSGESMVAEAHVSG